MRVCPPDTVSYTVVEAEDDSNSEEADNLSEVDADANTVKLLERG